jgi:hypothetical protein
LSQTAVINEANIGDPEVAFAAAAIDAQLREDFLPLWPEVDYQPVSFFATKKDLPVASGLSIIFAVVEDLGDPDAAAYHSWAGVPFAKIGRGLGELSVLLGHEALEEIVDPKCDALVTLPSGDRGAREVCDPVQGWTYDKTVTVLGETRTVQVPAFVTPAWFDGGPGPTYFCPGMNFDLRPGQIAPGGYLPVITLGGIWDNIYGAQASDELKAEKAKRARYAMSRAARRAKL